MMPAGRSSSICLLLFWLLTGFVRPARGQSYSFTHYDLKDGLSGITVHGMTQDRDGFIWMATETGLSVFDGSHFRNYRREDGLPSNEVFAVFLDSRDRIWIITYKNAICYFYKGKIHNQQNDPVLKKITLKTEVMSLGEDTKGNIIALSWNGQWTIQPDGGLSWLSPLALPDSIHNRVVAGVGFHFPTRMANTWYRPEGDLSYIAHVRDQNFDPAKEVFIFKYPTEAQAFRKGKLLASISLTPKARVKPVNDSVVAILGDTITGAGFYNLYQSRYVCRYLEGYTVNDVFRDIEGNLWFSTKESGVFKLNPAAFRFFSFREQGPPVAVISLFNFNGHIFATTSTDECWQLISTDPLRFRKIAPGALSRFPMYFGRQHLPEMIIYAGSDFLGLTLPATSVKSLMSFGDTLLLSTNNNARLVHYPSRKEIGIIHKGRSTCSIRMGNDYYIGTLSGLYRVDRNGKETFPGKDYPALRDRISSFALGEDGVLWIATYENGVVAYKDGKVIANITQRNSGLSSNMCRCICSRGKDLWIGTEKGLNRVEQIEEGLYRVVQKFTMADGLTSDIVNAVYVDSNQVLAGTSDGLVCFDNNKTARRGLCRLHLTDMRVSDVPLDVDSNGFVLSHKNNNISFEFAAISFLSGDDITCMYRLRGLEGAWKKAQGRILSYPSLPSGKYTLEIVAINKFKDSSAVLTRSFEITPALPERKWFQLTALLALAGSCALVIHLRIKVVQRKNRERNEIRRQITLLEQAALKAQMNPHFIFNCLNSLQHYILKRDMVQVSMYLSKFANLVRQTLDNAPRLFLLLREELDYLENYIALEKLQMGDAMQYSIWVDPALDTESIKVPNMIIQPFVENAVKHGVGPLSSNATLCLRFSYLAAENVMQCAIEDNGPGIRLTQELQQKNKRRHVPKGISITQSRIETLSHIQETKRKITVEIEEINPDAKYKGTRVVIRFPL